MKVVILAGGLGSRLSEETHKIPKPMVKIGDKPIIEHIISHYLKFGFSEVIICAGYKKEVIIDHFKNKKNIHVEDTGLNSQSGARIKKIKHLIGEDKSFFMTYGDGLCDINLNNLEKFHKRHKNLASVTAVHPPVRFGELKIKNTKIIRFDEKPELKTSWINGGFFILNYKIFDYIKNDKTVFEKFPLEKLAKNKKLMAYKHEGFWKCMDNLGDKKFLDKICKEKRKVPWIK